jgi:hypothetical protein
MEKAKKLSFNSGFYSLSSVKKSVRDFKDAADFSVKKDKERIDVSIYNFDDGLADNIAGEFSNYVLFIEATERHEKAVKNK